MHILEVLQPAISYNGNLKPLFLALLIKYIMCYQLNVYYAELVEQYSITQASVSPNRYSRCDSMRSECYSFKICDYL